jgi:hypothetical protein
MRTHDAGLGQGVVVLNEKEIHHEPDGVAGGEVFPGGLVGNFGELADEFLEHRAHLVIADDIGMEVNVGKLFRDEVEQAGLSSLSIWVWNSKLSKMSRTAGENACR